MTHIRHLTIIVVLCLVACAPVPPDRLQTVRQLIARAYAQGAPNYAPEPYQRAYRELELAEKALQARDREEAEQWVARAEKSALATLYRTRQQKRQLLEKQQVALEPFQGRPAAPVQPSTPEEGVPSAIIGVETGESEPVTQAVPEPPKQEEPVVKKKPGRKSVKPKPVTLVKVREGESLFMIARRRDVYGDALLWPLIYQANRDQIKDPRQIFPGQELMVPRGLPEVDMQRAREYARQSNIFPME